MQHRNRNSVRQETTLAALVLGVAMIVALAAPAGVSLADRGPAAAASAKTTLRGWGSNAEGELGHGNRTPFSNAPVTVRVPSGASVTSVRAGCDHSVALTSTGRILTWGADNWGQLGNGTTASRAKPGYVKLPKGAKVKAVRAGCEDTIALTTTGRVLDWGLGVEGQLGNGSTASRHVPVYVRLPKHTKVTAISAGCHFNLALTSSGKVLAWGQDLEGELGNGHLQDKDVPVQVRLPSGAQATAVTAGCLHAFAITRIGLFGWGDNDQGQLGDGSTSNAVKTPEEIVFLTRGHPLGTITDLYAGCYHTIALFSGGGVLTWGYNIYGQLGNGTTTSSDKPVGVMLPAGVTIKAVSASCDASYALTAQGEVLAWGNNQQGQLGDNVGISTDVPVKVALPASLAINALGAGPGANHAFVIARANPG